MPAHIAHATATFAELSIAMSIAMLTKIIMPAPVVDALARETTRERVKESDGKLVTVIYGFGCWISDTLGSITSNIPFVSLILSLASLIGLGFCSSTSYLAEVSQFISAATSFVLISGYIYFVRESLAKTNESPLVEPVE